MKHYLKSSINYIDEIEEYVNESHNYERGCKLIFKIKDFLKQTPELWMFIPCKLVDGVWVVFEEPTLDSIKLMPLTSEGWDGKYYRLKKEYQQAKERVLFEGFEVVSINGDFTVLQHKDFQLIFDYESNLITVNHPKFTDYIETIEDFTINRFEKYNIELTKQSGL